MLADLEAVAGSSEECARQITMFAFHYFWLVAVRTPVIYLSSSSNTDKLSSSAPGPTLIPSFSSPTLLVEGHQKIDL